MGPARWSNVTRWGVRVVVKQAMAAGLATAWAVGSPAAAQWVARPYPFYYPGPVYPPAYNPPPPVYRPVYPPPPVYAPPMYAPPVYAPPVYPPPVYAPPVYTPPPPPRPSAALMEVQRSLGQLGFDPGPVDGLPGPRLSEAVQAFQRAHDQSPTGRLSGETIGAIREAARMRASQIVPLPEAPSERAPDRTGSPSTPRPTLSVKPAAR